MARRPSVYLAGPDVFLTDAVALGARKKVLCAQYGFDGLFPLDDERADPAAGTPLDALIYRRCVAMLRQADFAIAHLTPFRGASADVGTVFELGMLVGLGKPVFGYTNDPADLLARVRRGTALRFDPTEQMWRDGAGLMVENFGNADNLMIDRALAEQGHDLIRPAAQPADYFGDLTGFEACLRLAAAMLSRG